MQRSLAPLIAVLCVSACVPPKVAERGHADRAGRSERITPGETTRSQVRAWLGTPSITNQFGEETWYYISYRKEGVAFLAPEVTRQSVMKLTFGPAGTVASLETYDERDGHDIRVAQEHTPTTGDELTFLEQMLGNIGRGNVSPSGLSRNPAGRRGAGRGPLP